MSFFYKKIDSHISVYQIGIDTNTGFNSIYKDVIHPATKSKIEGFKFNKTFWTNETQQNTLLEEPKIDKPSIVGIEDKFQSGIGSEDDLQVLSIENNVDLKWRPILNHGYFYFQEKENYLFSDSSLQKIVNKDSIYVSPTTTISGGNYSILDFNPKPGTPILVRSFVWDNNTGSYTTFLKAKVSSQFTQKFSEDILLTEVGGEYIWENIQQSVPECILKDNLTFIFNKDITEKVGKEINILDYNLYDLQAMEDVGVTLESDFQEHHLKFAPIDNSQSVQIILEGNSSIFEVSIVEEFNTSSGVYEAIVDYDLGIIKFGSAELGEKPLSNYKIRASYTKSFAIEYEPIYSSDTGKNRFDSINPVSKYSANGFVFIQKEANNPTSLVLSADLPELETNYFGPLFIGNNFTKINAEVLDQNNIPIEGQEIFFEIVEGPSSARLGNDFSSSAFSNQNGIAKTIFNPPSTITEMGGATDVINLGVGTTNLFIEDYFPPTDTESLYLFQVHKEDNILGIPKSELVSYYENYIQEQGSLTSQTLGPKIVEDISGLGNYSWIVSTYADFIKWEVLYRSLNNLATPTTYEADDLITGKKTIVAEFSSSGINPHTGTTSAFVPVQPSSFTITDSGVDINFNTELPAIGSLYKSYLVVGPNKVTIRAYTINSRTNQKIYSNNIDILIDLSSASNGQLFIDTINSLSSGVLNNARFWEQEFIELENVNLTSNGLLPIGFRLRSTGITIASALDSITFLDINPLTEPDDTIANEFTVEI